MTDPLPVDSQARLDAKFLRLLARLPDLLPSNKTRLREIADRIDPKVTP